MTRTARRPPTSDDATQRYGSSNYSSVEDVLDKSEIAGLTPMQISKMARSELVRVIQAANISLLRKELLTCLKLYVRETMRPFSGMLIVALLLISISGCDMGPKSAKGFSLPDGDAKQGELTFVELNCHSCHTVSGVQLPGEEREQTIKLGGEVSRIKTYGELVTSIINPSHKLAKGYSPGVVESEEGQSTMKNYNDAMTVSQLIDLVAFLQSHYKLREYEQTDYRAYPLSISHP